MAEPHPHPPEPPPGSPIELPPADLPDPNAPMFPEPTAMERRDPERGQHLVWVALALVIMVLMWWGL